MTLLTRMVDKNINISSLVFAANARIFQPEEQRSKADNSPSQDQMVILQDLPRFLQKMVILHDLAKNGYLARSCKKSGYLARFLQVRSGRAVLSLTVLDALSFI